MFHGPLRVVAEVNGGRLFQKVLPRGEPKMSLLRFVRFAARGVVKMCLVTPHGKTLGLLPSLLPFCLL